VVLALLSFVCFPLLRADVERFSVAIGLHGNLVISAPGGQTVADVAGQAVGQNITVGNSTLQVSYGRDASGQLTAILTAPDVKTVALHFSACGKSIDADKAVVTLTFSPGLKGVLVDPGYVGTVEVDSHVLRSHSLADDLPIPAAALASTPSDAVLPDLAPPPAPPVEEIPDKTVPASLSVPGTTPEVATTSSATAASPESTTTSSTDTSSTQEQSAPKEAQSATTSTGTATPSTPATPPGTQSLAPPLLASQIKPILPPLPNQDQINQPAPQYESVYQRLLANAPPIVPPSTLAGPDGMRQEKLYWAEPVTAPDGTAPAVAANEIRLVEVYGMVTVTPPGGAEQTGTEGMVVPSGSMVQTADGSSTALFMGGVNSARLMPKCALVVTQTLAGSLRTNVINLQAGAVFARIGQRNGETENFSIITPEGTSEEGATDMLAYRGSPDDLRAGATVRAGFLDTGRLLAWDPAPSHGLISDVPGLGLGGISFGAMSPSSTYFFYPHSNGAIQSDNIPGQVLGGGAMSRLSQYGQDGNALYTQPGSPNGRNNGNPNSGGGQPVGPPSQSILQKILETLQPFNKKLNCVITAINNGTATSCQLAFYQKLTSVFFTVQAPDIVNQFERLHKGFLRNEGNYAKILGQDINEFQNYCLTPH
jgi:hypothetical protein